MTTRSLIASTFPLAVSAGLFLAHCSGSSAGGSDAGQTGTGSGTGVSMGTGAGTGTGVGTMGTGTGVGTMGTGTGTGVGTMGTGTGTGVGTMGTGTGTGTGATCGSGPSGGAACDPGVVICSTGTTGASCNVPAQACCFANDAGTCVTAGASCGGDTLTCDEKADCTGGQICCLNVTSLTGAFTISCQSGSCPTTGIAHAEICKTNAECPGGSCSIFNCMGQILEACENPAPAIDPGACTAM